MSKLVINESQRHQHRFLLESFQTRTSLSFDNGSWHRESISSTENDNETMTFWGQSLTFDQIEGVIQALSGVLTINAIRRHPFCTTFGETVLIAEITLNKPDQLTAKLDQVCNVFHIDVAVQQYQPRLDLPGLLVMDMDSTAIQIECIDEIARLAGRGEEVSAVTAKAMRGELDFNESLISRVACLEGVPVAQLEQIRNAMPLTFGIQFLVRELKLRNWRIAIASGGFTYFADYLKERLGLDAAFSNTLETRQGCLTGKVAGDIVNAEVKAQKVDELAQQYAITNSQCIAMGDGANDLAMMARAGFGVACHAKPLVNEKADAAIRFSGLHSLLYLLGQ